MSNAKRSLISSMKEWVTFLFFDFFDRIKSSFLTSSLRLQYQGSTTSFYFLEAPELLAAASRFWLADIKIAGMEEEPSLETSDVADGWVGPTKKAMGAM